MKHIPFILCFSWACWLLTFAAAQEQPNFAPGQYILCNGKPMLGDNKYTAVSICDWNADGKKDLLLGMMYDGYVALFLNVGTDDAPIFESGAPLRADGRLIQVGFF